MWAAIAVTCRNERLPVGFKMGLGRPAQDPCKTNANLDLTKRAAEVGLIFRDCSPAEIGESDLD